MQPEDIIQTKEWQELSSTEIQILSALAPTEAEFNLLKKMLQVSQEALQEVPVISSHVKQELLHSVKKNEARRIDPVWYYVAASVLAIVLAAILLLKKDTGSEGLVVTPPAKKIEVPVVMKKDSTVNRQQENIAIHAAPDKKDQHIIIQPHRVIPDKNNPQVISPADNSYTGIISTVEQDSSLLALITEVY